MNDSSEFSPIRAAMVRVWPGYFWLFGLSLFINLLLLVTPLYMMQMSNRVMVSQNWTTLGFLFVLAAFLVMVWAMLDAVRTRALRSIGMSLDANLAPRVFSALARLGGEQAKMQFVTISQDFNTFREMVSGRMVLAVFDVLWSPVFIAVLFLIHPYFGWLFIALAVIIAATSLVVQFLTRGPSKRAQDCNIKEVNYANVVGRNADTARAMGMVPVLQERWFKLHRASLGWQDDAMKRARWGAALNSYLHRMQMILVMTLGVMLVLTQELGAGGMFGAVLLMRIALGPIEQLVTGWRSIANSRHSFARVNQLLRDSERPESFVDLPSPQGQLAVNRLTAGAPDREAAILHDVSFSANPGQVVAIVGPSGAGKSAMAKVLTGIWSPRRGNVTIDGHDIAHWDADKLGPHIGYVPQEIEMFPGTVAENIGRFGASGPIDAEAVMRAVEGAGIADLVQSLPKGLNTPLGPGGHILSGGQRQRLALARAIYGNPRVVVMDEPNSNLDAAAEQALGRTLQMLRDNKVTVVVVTHKLSLLIYCDLVVVMNAGAVQAFGAREEIVSRLSPPRPAAKLTVIEGESRIAIGEK